MRNSYCVSCGKVFQNPGTDSYLNCPECVHTHDRITLERIQNARHSRQSMHDACRILLVSREDGNDLLDLIVAANVPRLSAAKIAWESNPSCSKCGQDLPGEIDPERWKKLAGATVFAMEILVSERIQTGNWEII